MISRTRYKTTERNATVRQSEVNMGEPWEPVIEVENIRGKGEYFYLVNKSEKHVVYQNMSGDKLTILKEEE